MGYKKVLEDFSWGSWKVLKKFWNFFSRVETLCDTCVYPPYPVGFINNPPKTHSKLNLILVSSFTNNEVFYYG